MKNLELKNFGSNSVKSQFLKFSPTFHNLNSSKYSLIPAFIDVHVHFREPGFSYKETILTGSKAAAKGGYTTVATMPNVKPVSDTLEHLQQQIKIIKKDAIIQVIPYGSITINEDGNELAPLEKTANKVIAFSDDGKGIQDEQLMKQAMQKAKALNKIIVAHCEVNSLSNGGYIHDGLYAKQHNHKGNCSASEYKEVERDLKLVRQTKCKFHICHVSTKETVELVRKAKKAGLDVTCETAPHYLIFNDSMLKENGDFKINPPIRSKADQLALIKGIKDGTIDMIATDHAPHSKIEKSKGLKNSMFGASGLEVAFPVLYTYLVKKKIITMKKLLDLLVYNPRKRFNLKDTGDYSIWNLNESYKIDPNKFISKGKSSPFRGKKVFGVNYLTVHKGKIVYKR